MGVVLAGTWIAAWRGRWSGRVSRPLFWLITIAAVLYPLQAVVGALQVWTQLAPWTQTLHVALAAFIWTAAVGATFVSYYGARAAVPPGVPVAGTGARGGEGVQHAGAAAAGRRGRARSGRRRRTCDGRRTGDRRVAGPGPSRSSSPGPSRRAASVTRSAPTLP